jgi:hypothetical protein
MATIWVETDIRLLSLAGPRRFESLSDNLIAGAWHARPAIVWGTAGLVEATLCVCAAVLLLPNVAVIVEPILAIGTITGLLVWTTVYAQQRATPLPAPAASA